MCTVCTLGWQDTPNLTKDFHSQNGRYNTKRTVAFGFGCQNAVRLANQTVPDFHTTPNVSLSTIGHQVDSFCAMVGTVYLHH